MVQQQVYHSWKKRTRPNPHLRPAPDLNQTGVIRLTGQQPGEEAISTSPLQCLLSNRDGKRTGEEFPARDLGQGIEHHRMYASDRTRIAKDRRKSELPSKTTQEEPTLNSVRDDPDVRDATHHVAK
ncbi:hypothetical protein RHS02_05553, partial [Rhizoctonia solani]